VKLIALNGFPFYDYSQGETFGESDALLKELRDCKVVAARMCTLYSIKFEDVEELLDANPDIYAKLKTEAIAKRQKHEKIKKRLEKKQPVYGINDLNDDKLRKRMGKLGIDLPSKKIFTKDTKTTTEMLLPFFGELDLVHLENKEYSPECLKALASYVRDKIKIIDQGFNKNTSYQRDVTDSLKDIEIQIQNEQQKENPNYADILFSLKQI
jgi:hypothetical protein